MDSKKGFLVLTRKPGDGILIGDNIKIYILHIAQGRNRVRIAIDAPRDLKVGKLEKLHLIEVYEDDNEEARS